MRFLYYKVVSLVNQKLNINYCEKILNPDTSDGADDIKLNLASKYNLLYISLFIYPEKDTEIKPDNICDFISNIYGIANSKKFAAGNRSIPEDCRYEDNVPDWVHRKRYNFFKELVRNKSELQDTYEKLENMVRNSCNVTQSAKEKILNLRCNDLFTRVFCNEIENESTSDEEIYYIKIFKIMAYSTFYCDTKQPCDNLTKNYFVNANFINRDNVITELTKAFENTNIVYLCGIRGCGKTEIVQKYISESSFYGVATLFFGTDLDETLAKENIFNLKPPFIDNYTKAFCNLDEHYLLVIEGVSSKLDNKWRDFIKQCGCKVLVVSSWKPNEDDNTIVTVSKLSELQAVSMMDNYLKTEGRLTTEQKYKIVKMLNCHALAVTVYAKAIEKSCLEYDEIISILNKSLVSDEIEEKVIYKENIEAKLACQHIQDLFEKTFENLHSDGVEIVLRVMSLMPDSGIPLKDLQKYTGLKNNNAINNTLKRLFWLEVTTNSERIVTIHSIVRDIVREMLKPDINNCNTLVDCVYNGISQYWGYSEEGITYRKLYFSILKNIICVSSNDNLKVFDFMVKGISSLLNYGYVAEARIVYDKATDYIRTLTEEEIDDFNYVLSVFSYQFSREITLKKFISVHSKKIEILISTISPKIEDSSVAKWKKTRICFALLQNFSSYFQRVVELSENTKQSTILEVNSNIQKLYMKVQTILMKVYPSYIPCMFPIREEDELVFNTKLNVPLFADYKTKNLIYRITFNYMKYLSLIIDKEPETSIVLYRSFIYNQTQYKTDYSGNILYLQYLFAFYKYYLKLFKCESIRLKNEIIHTYYTEGFDKFPFEYIRQIVEAFELDHNEQTYLNEL